MRLHKRTIRTISDHKIIQLMTPAGKIVAEFHDPEMYALMTFPKGVAVYDEDTCQLVAASIDQLDDAMGPAILALETAGLREAASLLRREVK